MAQARQLTLTDEQQRDLLDCREHHPKAYMREKAAAILKVAAGHAVRQVAAHGLLRPRQPKPVGRWIDRYLAEGRDGLLVRTGRGRKPAFFPRRQDEVKSDLQEQVYRSPHFCGLTCSRWSQERLRQTVPWMRPLSLPGISKLLRRLGVSYQRGRVHITSPDPLYVQKMEAIAEARMRCMWLPKRFVFLYEDEHTFGRQPSASLAYGRRGGPTPKAVQAARYWTKRRIAGCLDVQTGALISRERSRFNVREMAAFFLLVEKQSPDAERIFIALDNWPVHFHGYVLDTLREQHSRITLLPLPTYAPWTNPIEKVWRQFNQDLFHMHPWSEDWQRLRQEVTRWLQAASTASEDLLRYVGLASVTDQLFYGT